MKKTEEFLEDWNPHDDEKIDSDPFRTLFIARYALLRSSNIIFQNTYFRINYDTSESKLKREFEEFGRIRSVRYRF